MTNERAIELLKRISDSQFDGIHGDERREALEMAVRALFSQQTVNDSQGLVNDCISRKMAIDAFEPEHDTDWYTPQIIEVLEALPPVQPMHTNADSTQINVLDCVSRQDAIDALDKHIDTFDVIDTNYLRGLRTAMSFLKKMPSAQLDPQEIGYWECSNALLKMWIDNILTDGEYYRIADKLNTYWKDKIRSKNGE